MSSTDPAESSQPAPRATDSDIDVTDRPHNLSQEELGFSRRRPVPWLAPSLLAGTAIRVVGAALFGANLDKRELQAALPSRVDDHSSPDELWFDYVADIGDGFDATYSIAYLLAQPSLTVPDPDGTEHDLPRGRLLVMGGDEVYPTPSWQRYENRTVGPYLAAYPERSAKPPSLYALPGNHDWYDGLTSFLRLFAKGSRFGGWRTRQSRSYFAMALPHRWWLFAIDSGLDAYLDDPQLQYFKDAARGLRPGDRVIVCTPSPSWVFGAYEPSSYDTIDYFIRKVVTPTGATVPVMLTGDLHHYARYGRVSTDPTGTPEDPAETSPEAARTGPSVDDDQQVSPNTGGVRTDNRASGTAADPEEPGEAGTSAPPHRSVAPQTLITCGGGGAYLYPTHTLPPTLDVPPERPQRRKRSPSERYTLDTTFPSRETSRRYSWGIFGRLPSHNPGFGVVLGVLQALLMYAFITAGPRVLTLPVLVLSLAVLGSTVAFALAEVDVHHKTAHWLAGIGHGVAHLALAALGAFLWWELPLAHLPGPIPVLLSIVIYLPVAGLVATELTALYLLIVSRFGVNVNELFAGQTIEDAKSFLRLRIGADGSLTIYPIGLDRVGRHWHAAPGGEPGSPWIVPNRPLTPRLIEPPLRH